MAQDDSKQTALHLAVRRKASEDIIKLLLEYLTDDQAAALQFLLVENSEGKVALHLTKGSQSKSILMSV